MSQRIGAAARAQWGGQNWLNLAYLVTGLPAGIITFTIAVTGLSTGIGLVPLFLVGLLLLFGLTYMVRWLMVAERYRTFFLTDTFLPPRRDLPTGWRRILEPAVWQELLYCVLLLPVATVTMGVAVSSWSLAIAGLLFPLYGPWLPGSGIVGLDWPLPLELAAGFLLGLSEVLLAPTITRAFTRFHLWLARALLTQNDHERLTAQVGQLQESRSRVLDAADAERRRIERDLHDGTQQHLVSVAMTLGLAQSKLDQGAPETEIRELIDQAHREAKDSIVELRNVIRGVYPAVLTDCGLDAALSALAARSPVPVQLAVDIPQRPSPTIEAIAYFVVSECLTNVARHAQAGAVRVTVKREESLLRIVISDNGCGGAKLPAAGTAGTGGTGLMGLRDRVAAVEGTLSVTSHALSLATTTFGLGHAADSPKTGTTVVALLPCG